MQIEVAAQILNKASEALFEYIKNNHGLDKPVVILGRDAWPFVPLLRERYGLPNVHYFLFSRLQIGDEGTKSQWLLEVPKGALVVDTGYQGSIFDAIREFDPSTKGVLISSNGKYPQLELDISHKEVVKGIEKMPKIIGRCVAINSEGKARCPQDTRDDDEAGTLSASEVILWNKGLLKELGLPAKWASFTGITAKSRIPGTNLKLAYLKAALSRKRSSINSLSRWEVRKLIKSRCPFIESFIRNFLVPGGISPSYIEVSSNNAYFDVLYFNVSNDPNIYLLRYDKRGKFWQFKKNGSVFFKVKEGALMITQPWPGGFLPPSYISDKDYDYEG